MTRRSAVADAKRRTTGWTMAERFKSHYEVIVIGAGFTGLSTALHLRFDGSY